MDNVVLISGKLMSGKSTLSSALAKMSSAYRVTPLALELKEDIAGLCRVSVDYLNEHKDKFRFILQNYGTDIMRDIWTEYFWVNRLRERWQREGINSAIVDDVRFTSELYGFDAYETFKVRLQISEDEQIKRYVEKFARRPDPSIFTHASETALDSVGSEAYDIVVQVDGASPLEVTRVVLRAMEQSGFKFPIDNSILLGI